MLLKGFPMIPLSCRSNLAGRYLMQQNNFTVRINYELYLGVDLVQIVLFLIDDILVVEQNT